MIKRIYQILGKVLGIIFIVAITLAITGFGTYQMLKYGWDPGVAEPVNKYVFFVVWAILGGGTLFGVFFSSKDNQDK